MANKVLPLPNEPAVGGSTDVGDVSWIVPTMGDGGVAEAGQRVIAP
jgi:metal-dependent amidase/aminoacylase/carboxypeptidase family protein